jgi:hypothetical protein
LADQVEVILSRFADLDISAIRIGKSSVGRKKKVPVFDKTNDRTWAVASLSKRWALYRAEPAVADKSQALIVIECFHSSDLPGAVIACGFSAQEAALNFE